MRQDQVESHCKVARTYRLSEEIVAGVDALAAQYGVPQSQVVEHLLRDSMRRMDEGRLAIRTRPVAWQVDFSTADSDA